MKEMNKIEFQWIKDNANCPWDFLCESKTVTLQVIFLISQGVVNPSCSC